MWVEPGGGTLRILVEEQVVAQPACAADNTYRVRLDSLLNIARTQQRGGLAMQLWRRLSQEDEEAASLVRWTRQQT